MECGELSVMDGTGTPGMLLWHAGSCGTSMKVSTPILILNLEVLLYKRLYQISYIEARWFIGKGEGTKEATSCQQNKVP